MQANSTGSVGGQFEGEHLNFAGALLDCIAHGIIAIGSNRHILAFNEPAERLTGLRATDLLNRPVSVLPAPLQAVIDETFVTGRAVSHRDVLLAQGNGTDLLLQATTTIAQQPGDGVLSVLAELQNVSQARSMATNLEHLDRLASLGVLGASVVHEIKNALVPIRTFVDMPAEARADPEMNDLVGQEIRRMDAVVRQMLRGATREEFKLAPLNFHALLRDALNLLRHEFQARSVKLDAKLSATSDRINGDDRQLRHVIFNLLINAIEAMRESGGDSARLIVATEVANLWERPHLRVSISDTGSGISSENLARLFSPFFTTKREGTGLGLAITRRIIHEHNGAITVESKPNEGTTFHLFLPLLSGK
jgi:signal transduction histidine kinase